MQRDHTPEGVILRLTDKEARRAAKAGLTVNGDKTIGPVSPAQADQWTTRISSAVITEPKRRSRDRR